MMSNPKQIQTELLNELAELRQFKQQTQKLLDRRDRQVQLSIEVAQQIAFATDLNGLYRRIVKLIRKQLDYNHIQLLHRDPVSGALGLAAASGESGVHLLAEPYLAAIGEDGLIGLAAATGVSVLCSDLAQAPSGQSLAILANTKSRLSVPVKVGGEDVKTQAASLEYFINNGFDGFVVTAIGPAIIAPVAKKALDKGMAVVAHTVDLGSHNQSALVWATEYELGYTLGIQAGQWAKTHLPTGQKLKVGVLNYRLIPQVIQREEGIVQGIKEIFGHNVEIVDSETAGDPTQGLAVAEEWLEIYPDLNMIVGINDGGALGAYQAVIAAGKNDPDKFFIGGIDATDEALAAIQDKSVYQATVDQSPREMGKQAVRTLVTAIAGQPFQPVNTIKCSPVNPANIDEFLLGRQRRLATQKASKKDVLAGLDLSRIKIGLSVINLSNPFFAAFVSAAKKEAERLGVKLVVNDPKPVLGVLDIQSDVAGSLSSEDQLLLEGLCDQIALAINNYQVEAQRQQTEEALRESEQRFRNAFDHAFSGMVLVNTEGRFLQVNHYLCQLLGYSEQELLALNFQAITHPDDLDKSIVYLRQIWAGEINSFKEEKRYLHKLGHVIWVQINVSLVRDAAGKPIYFVTQIQDITERKRAEEALAKRATELETAARVSAAASTILEPIKLLQVVTNLTKSSFNLYHAHIYLLNEAGDMLRLVAGAGKIGRQMVAQGWSIPLTQEQSLVARAARTRQGVIVNNVQAAPDWLPNPLLPNTRSELAIPLIVGTRLLGVLDVQSDEIGHFTEEDMRIQTTLAAQIAVALQNAKSFEQSRVALAETRMLYDISVRFNTAQSLEELLEAAISPGILAGASSAGIWLFDADAAGQPEWMEFTATWVREGEPLVPLGTRLRLVDFPSHKVWINASGQSTFISNIEHDERVDPHLQATFIQVGVRAVAFMPLTIGGRWVGLTIISWLTPHTFSPSEQQLYQSIAVQTAVAIENRHLFAQTQAALAEVQQSQRLLRSAIDATPDWIIIKDRNHRFLLVNQSFANSVNLTPEDLIGKTDLDLGVPEDLVKGNPEKGIRGFWTDDLEVINSGQSKFIPEEPIITDGQLRFLSTTKVPLRDDLGEVWSLLVFVHDITERKRAEQDLLKFKLGIEQSDEAIFLTDTNGVIISINPAFEKIYGFTREESIGHTPRILKSGLIPQEAYEHFWKKLLAKERVAGEVVNKAKDGRLVHIAGNNNPILDEQGNIIGFLAVHRDITVQKQAEEALQQNEALLRTVIDSTPDWIFIKDQEHRYQLVNQSYAASLHLAPADIIGKNDLDLGFPEETVKGNPEKGIMGFWTHDQEVMDTGESRFVAESLGVVDGQLVVFSTLKVPLRDIQDKVWGVLGFVQDITERKRAEETLARRATELQTVAQVGTAASTILDTHELLEEVVNLTRSRFELYHTHIYLLNEAGDTLQLAAGAGEVGRQMVAQGWSIPLAREQSLVVQAARGRQGVIAKNVQAAPEFMPNPLLPETHSELAVPLIVGDQVLGVLDVQSDKLDHFSEEDIHIQTTLAAQVAVALQNARSFAEQQRVNLLINKRVKELNCLNEIGREIPETPLIPEFLQWVTERIPPAMQYPEICRAAIEYDGQVYGAAEVIDLPYQVVHALRMAGQVIGRVYIAYTQKRDFLDEESALIGGIAGRVSGYIESRRLFEQVQDALIEVEQSQQFLRALLDNIPYPVFFKDVNGAYLGFNRAFLDYIGRPEEELLGKTVYDLNTNKELADKYHEMDMALIHDPGAQVYEASVKYADGTLRDVIFNKTTFTQPDGSLGGLVGTIVDITERKRAEEALQQSEARYRTLAQNIPIGIYRNSPGPHGKFLMVNEAMAHIFGYSSAEELMQYRPVDLYRDPAERKVFSDKMLAQGKVINEEMEFNRKDGTQLWVSMTATAVRDETGQVAYFDGTIEDITDRKKVEEALRDNEARLSEALKIARMSTWGLHLKSQMISLSPEHLVMMGLEVTHSSGLSMPIKKYTQEYVVAEDIPLFDERVEYAIDSISRPDYEDRLGQGKFEYRLKCLDGQIRYMAVFSRRRMDMPWVILGITQDITEQKQAELERERLLAEVQGAYRQYVHREWEQFLSEQQQSQLRIEHQQKTSGSLSDEELAKVQAEVVREGKAKVIARHNGDSTQPTIVAPIALRGQIIGTLSLQDIDPDRRWTAEERALVETVSEQLALTVENLRLFDDTQKRAMREQLTRQITDKMRAAPDIDSIVQTGLNELAKALNVSRAYVKLTTKPEDE